MTSSVRPSGLRPPEEPRPRPAAETTRAPGPARPAASGDDAEDSALADLRRSERVMILVRWGGVLFAVVQVLAYRTRPYPAGIEATALGVAGLLGLANLAIWAIHRRTATVRGARALAVGALSLDVLVASAFAWLYAFDPISALWALLFILPLEGAIRFELPGALLSWAAVTVLYIGREIYAEVMYGDPFEPESVSFRMGIGLLIALVAGLMARNLMRQRGALSRALSELRRTDTLRSRLVATLAHDVRNPLTTIRGTLKTLTRHGERLDPRTSAELISTAERQAERLERLANDLLDLARTERGRLELHIVDVPLAGAVAGALSFVDEDHLFTTEVDPGLIVRADPERLEQMLVNLASNAFRYGEPPFGIRSSRGRDGMVELDISDHGQGVPPEEVELLFEPFRADVDRGSVGLGLAIVRALAEAQGGSVTYEPNVPRGARFTVRLKPAR